MKPTSSAFNKRSNKNRQQIKSIMSEIYKEISPNSKILKYLFQDPIYHSVNHNSKAPTHPKYNHSHNFPIKPKISNFNISEKEGFISINKDFTIEGLQIDELYKKSLENSRKHDYKLQKFDKILFQTLKKKQENPLNFSQSLKKKIQRFMANSLEISSENQKEGEQNKKKNEFKNKANRKNLHQTIMKRIEQKNGSFVNTKAIENSICFLQIYRDIEHNQKQSCETPDKSNKSPKKIDFPVITRENSLRESPKSENVFKNNSQYLKRMTIIEKLKLDDQMLQTSKERLVEKLNTLALEGRKKSKTLHENMSTIEKIKRKYQFFNLIPPQKQKEELKQFFPITKTSKEPQIGSNQEKSHVLSLTLNQKIRRCFLNRNSSSSEIEKPIPHEYINGCNEETINKWSEYKKWRQCDDIVKLKEQKEVYKTKSRNLPFFENFKKLKKDYPKEKKSNGLLKEMKKGFAEIEKKLKGFKNQLNDVPESLTLVLSD